MPRLFFVPKAIPVRRTDVLEVVDELDGLRCGVDACCPRLHEQSRRQSPSALVLMCGSFLQFPGRFDRQLQKRFGDLGARRARGRWRGRQGGGASTDGATSAAIVLQGEGARTPERRRRGARMRGARPRRPVRT
jgi:hypothetical protein